MRDIKQAFDDMLVNRRATAAGRACETISGAAHRGNAYRQCLSRSLNAERSRSPPETQSVSKYRGSPRQSFVNRQELVSLAPVVVYNASSSKITTWDKITRRRLLLVSRARWIVAIDSDPAFVVPPLLFGALAESECFLILRFFERLG